jgi:hypothetical protein
MNAGAGLLGAVGNFFGTAESPEKEQQEREPSEQLEEERPVKESAKKAPSRASDEQRSLSGVKVLSKGSNKSSQAKRQIDPEGEDKRNRDDYDKRLEESKKQILKDMNESKAQIQKSMASGSRKSIKINDIDINLDDLDMNKLTKEQDKDIKEIERLQ